MVGWPFESGIGKRKRLSTTPVSEPMWSLLLSLGLLWTAGAAWSPDAGIVQPLGGPSRTILVSSNPSAAPSIIDGVQSTAWQSDGCYPTGYISRPELNPVLNACNTAGRCTATTGSTSLNSAVDASFYTGAYIKLVSGAATMTISLIAPTSVYRVHFRGNWGTGAATVTLVSGSVRTVIARVNSTTNWVDQIIKPSVPWSGVSSVEVTCTASFTLTEIALQGARCFEQATLDLQAVSSINMIRARWWSTASYNTSLLTSVDGVTWTVVRADLVPTALPIQDLYFDQQPLTARYVAIKHMVIEVDWNKVYVWELAAYGAGGRWGLPPPVVPQTVSYRQLAGVNGIWGWGNNSFSTDLVAKGWGPVLYSPAASGGRNYQSMSWDVKKPGNDPKWDTMNKTGTDGQWWLDWDKEYRGWKQANLTVDVSYQFTAHDQPPASWPDAYSTAYTLGYKFTRHFGRQFGTNNVASFEAGNEPWDYNATFYTQLLRGFVEGAYAGDPTVKRLPCALQADDPSSETATGGNYIGARVPADLAPKLDALNIHTYSFFYNATGSRVGVHPEHPGSSMNGLHNMLAWRDANMPGTPVWVTEWGWDAYRPGETCGTATECVSQLAQAAYGIRGLSLMARKGVVASHWFFYANDNACQTLFCRSGLRDTLARGFAELPVYRAFKAFLTLAGSTYFKAAPLETSQLYAHVHSSTPGGTASHVLVWRPLAVGEVEQAADAVTLTFDVGFTASRAVQAWKISGAVPSGTTPASGMPVIAGTSWTMQVSSIPTLVSVA